MLSTQSVIHVSSLTAKPLDHTVVQLLDEIVLNDAEDEKDEDFLAEEPSFDQDDPLEPTLMKKSILGGGQVVEELLDVSCEWYRRLRHVLRKECSSKFNVRSHVV